MESAVDSTDEGAEQDQLIEQIFSSVLSNVEGDELLANSSANSRTASASSEQSYLILLDSVSEVVVRRAGESTSRLNRFVGAFIKSLPATGRSVAEIEQSYSSPVMTYITQRVIHRDSEQGTTVTMLSALSVIFVDGLSQLPLSSDYQSNLTTRVESVMTPVVSSTAGSDRDFSASVDTIFSGLSSTEVVAEPVEQDGEANPVEPTPTTPAVATETTEVAAAVTETVTVEVDQQQAQPESAAATATEAVVETVNVPGPDTTAPAALNSDQQW